MAEGPDARGPSHEGGGLTLTRDAVFNDHRGLVFTIAYDITGSVSDAEDVTQETYLRWRRANASVVNGRAYLATVAANQARNALRTHERRREAYVGPWLPEPLLTERFPGDPQEGDPELSAIRADAVSMALLVVLQSLSDDERIGFVLRDVFDFSYPEIAALLDRSEPATRQLLHRARGRVQGRRRRNVVDVDEHHRVVRHFIDAAGTGDIQALLAVLAPGVVLIADGGGKARAARRPIVGAERTSRFVLGLAEKYGDASDALAMELNGVLAVLVWEEGVVTTTIQFDVSGRRVAGIFVMRNPDKLAHLQMHAPC
jgi:RNA polymerase sigma-70 factor (ECF subfamily)